MAASIRIGELAARTGVSVRSLRYYEEQGLLTSLRSPSGHRRYVEGQVERILFIQRLFTARNSPPCEPRSEGLPLPEPERL